MLRVVKATTRVWFDELAFLGQRYNPEGNAKRKAKARIGARQYRKLVKAARRERRENPNG